MIVQWDDCVIDRLCDCAVYGLYDCLVDWMLDNLDIYLHSVMHVQGLVVQLSHALVVVIRCMCDFAI